MVGDGGVGVPAASAGLTVTVTEADDGSVSTVDALSVTCSSKAYVSPTVSVPAVTEHVSVSLPLAPVPLFTVHWVAAT
jgi:hypothetical protein